MTGTQAAKFMLSDHAKFWDEPTDLNHMIGLFEFAASLSPGPVWLKKAKWIGLEIWLRWNINRLGRDLANIRDEGKDLERVRDHEAQCKSVQRVYRQALGALDRVEQKSNVSSGRGIPSFLGFSDEDRPQIILEYIRRQTGWLDRLLRQNHNGLIPPIGVCLEEVYDIIREVCGHPFTPLGVEFNEIKRWQHLNGGAVRVMAERTYLERDFSRLPFLADLLEDSACCHEGILSHLRSERRHFPGCWVVELLRTEW